MYDPQPCYPPTSIEPPQDPLLSIPTPHANAISPDSSADNLRRKRKNSRCRCGYEPKGKGGNKTHNYKRHKKTCMKPLVRKAICGHPGCDKRYTRSDNLKVHQKAKKHRPDIDLVFDFSIFSPRADEFNASENKFDLGESGSFSHGESELVDWDQ
jgi:hypothetical protein